MNITELLTRFSLENNLNSLTLDANHRVSFKFDNKYTVTLDANPISQEIRLIGMVKQGPFDDPQIFRTLLEANFQSQVSATGYLALDKIYEQIVYCINLNTRVLDYEFFCHSLESFVNHYEYLVELWQDEQHIKHSNTSLSSNPACSLTVTEGICFP